MLYVCYSSLNLLYYTLNNTCIHLLYSIYTLTYTLTAVNIHRYHINVKHTKQSFPYITGDELSIYIDQKLIFQKPVKLPVFSGTTSAVQEICIGRDFNGQIGPIYMLHESLPQPVVECIAMLDARKDKNISDYNIHGANPAFPDLITELTINNKTYNIHNNIAICYHPTRCAYGHTLDIYADKNKPLKGGDKYKLTRAERRARHARLGKHTFPSQLVDIRDALETVGGIDAIITLFPRLLLSSSNSNSSNIDPVSGSGIGAGGAGRAAEPEKSVRDGKSGSPKPGNIVFGPSLHDLYKDSIIANIIHKDNILDLHLPEYNNEGCISLLFSILTLCLHDNRKLQKMFLEREYVDLIVYVLQRIPLVIYTYENYKTLPLTLLHLQTCTILIPRLEILITKRILCNFKIWYKCSYMYQITLLSIIIADVKSRPEYYMNTIGIQDMLDVLSLYYMDHILGVSATTATAMVSIV